LNLFYQRNDEYIARTLFWGILDREFFDDNHLVSYRFGDILQIKIVSLES